MAGPIPYPEYPFPESTPQHPSYPQPMASPYPGPLPPPVSYPVPRRRRRLGIAALALVVVAILAAAVASVAFASRHDRSASPGFTDASSNAAIQNYLTALTSGDEETIARNASCGFFDALKDRKPDISLAKLASVEFRKQFDSVEVVSIDKTVIVSPNQAQVLFTLRAVPAGNNNGKIERQGVAQLLLQGSDILVCSYLARAPQFN